MSSSWCVEGTVGSVARICLGSELPDVSLTHPCSPRGQPTLVNTAVIGHGEGDEALCVARVKVLVIVEVLVEFLALNWIRHLGGVDADPRPRECWTSRVWGRRNVVLGRVVVRRWRRLGLGTKMRAVGRWDMLLLRWRVRTRRSGCTPVVDLVQLRPTGVNVGLLLAV